MMSKLPIISTIFGAYGAVLKNAGTLIRAFMLPLLVLLVLKTIQDELSPSLFTDLIFRFLSLPFATLIAMACHRVILLGPASLNNPWSLYWTSRETSFFINMIILGALILLASWVFGLIFMMSPETPFGFSTPWLGLVLTYIAVTYLQGRFGMILPSTALGKNMFLSNSWYLTAGNGPRITIVLLAPLLILYGVMTMLGPVLLSLPDFAGVVIVLLIFITSFAVEIAALSLSYRFLRDSANSRN